jgi:hemerythrin-like metal-binding protein
MNSLSDAISKGQTQEILADILNELANYAKIHFEHEEEAMHQYSYPGLPEHLGEHSAFIKKVQELQEQFNAGTASIEISVYNFLTAWVFSHIQKTDKKYAEFFSEVGFH